MRPILTSLDYESELIRPGHPLPRPVCLSVCEERQAIPDPDIGWEGAYEAGEPRLYHCHFDKVREVMRDLLREAAEGRRILTGVNIAFDLAMAAKHHGLYPEVYKAYEAGAVRDLSLRTKFFHVQTHGNIDYQRLPDGSNKKLGYSMAALVEYWLGQDIWETKDPGSWRLRYGELFQTPISRWDQDAVDYALDDAKFPIEIWLRIEDKVNPQLFRTSNQAEVLANQAAFACMRCHVNGLRLDPFAAQRLFNKVRKGMHDIDMLIEEGFISPAIPARPYANGAQDHADDCPGKPCDCPPKMAAAKPRKGNDKVKRGWIRDFLRDIDPEMKVPLTDAAIDEYESARGVRKLKIPVGDDWFDENPRQLKVENETLEQHLVSGTTHQRDVISQYLKYQRTTKLWSSFLPGMMWDETNGCPAKETWKQPGTLSWAERVHPSFDVLKRTGRMSSWAGKLLPSCNIQQQDPEVRSCYVADPGYILVSIDYNALELYSAASTWKRLFGSSVLHDILQKGYDPHAYLGAQLAADMSDWDAPGGVEANYRAFLELKDSDDDDSRKFFKHWRTFAKPVGLGFPGGLGIATMRSIAWSMYGLTISEDQAKRARELWMELFPEARHYLQVWVNGQKDSQKNADGDPLFWYTTPGGMVRRGCTYTAAANGNSLQSPSAEGLRRVMFRLSKEMDVASPQWAVIRGCKLVAPIHDEVLVQVPIHQNWGDTVAAIDYIQTVMIEEMSAYLGIEVGVEAEAYYRWHKFLPSPDKALWAEGYKSFDPHIPIDPEPEYLAP